MITTIRTSKTTGIEGVPITVECTVTEGIGIHLVGLTDACVRESLLRTVTAMQSCGYTIPGKKVIINLSPSDLHRQGCAYDLPIALALIRASGQDSPVTPDGSDNLTDLLAGIGDWLAVGELGLDGSIRPVPGCVQAVETAIACGCKHVLIPAGNADEVADLFTEHDMPIFAASTLIEAVTLIAGCDTWAPTIWEEDNRKDAADAPASQKGWDLLEGDTQVMHALEIAAAGGHHVLLITDSPGFRYREALRDILPPPTPEETLSIARAYSAAGLGGELVSERRHGILRPARGAFPATSLTQLLGGGHGDTIVPGLATLASGGVLSLDGIADMPKALPDALRVALEDGTVTLSRLRAKVTFPARFQLVATTGFGPGEPPSTRISGILGPLYDRIDIQAAVNPRIHNGGPKEDAATVRSRVAEARVRQERRLGAGRLNARMDARETALHCHLGAESEEILEKIMTRLDLSAKAYTHILKIARTIADLDARDDIRPADIAEAASFRFLDRRTGWTTEKETDA